MTDQVVPSARAVSRDSERSSSTSAIFAWVGAILVNSAFIALVTWGTAMNWPIGVALCAVYAVVLFFVTGCLVRRNKQERPGSNGNSVLTSLLYLLFVGAVGVTGLLIPMNLFNCGGFPAFDSYSYPQEQVVYTTDTSNFPADVQAWADIENTEGSGSSFAFTESNVLVFSGMDSPSSSDSYMESAWVSSSGQRPVKLTGLQNPRNFIIVSGNSTTEHVCFVGVIDDYKNAIGCTIGADISATTQEFLMSPYDFFAGSDGNLWFRSSPDESWLFGKGAIYSLNPATPNESVVMHSVKSNNDSDGTPNGEKSSQCSNSLRFMNLTMLAISALPVLIASVLLYVRRKVPSMPLGLYAGLAGFVIHLTFVISPQFTQMSALLRWWFFLSSMIWLLVSTGAHLTNRLKASTLGWSINFSALVYFVSLFFLFRVFSSDNVGSWIGITLVGFIPLMLLSVFTARIFLMVLGAVGLLMDVWRLTDFIVGQADGSVRVPVQFVILAISGLLLGLLGFFLSKRQRTFQTKIDSWATEYLGRWRLQDEVDAPLERSESLALAEEGANSVGSPSPAKAVAQTGIVL